MKFQVMILIKQRMICEGGQITVSPIFLFRSTLTLDFPKVPLKLILRI
jgi:hypothetical protein